MENNTLYLENKLAFDYKTNGHKGAIAASIMVVVTTYLIFLCGTLLWKHPLVYLALPALFLLAGCISIRLLRKHIRTATAMERWLITGGLFLAVVLLLSLSLMWDDQLSLRSIIGSTSAFLLPFCIVELWQAYSEISYSDIRSWQFNDVGDDELPSIYLKSIAVRFKVIQEPDTGGGGVIPIAASARMSLSEVFLNMVQNERKKGQRTIALKSQESESYTWVFYKMDWQLWYRVLDPDKSLQANGISKNALIYVQQVSKEAFKNSIEEKQNSRQQ